MTEVRGTLSCARGFKLRLRSPSGRVVCCASLRRIRLEIKELPFMPINAEMIADPRRLRRTLSFWRVLPVLSLITAVIIGGLAVGGRAPVGEGQEQIARISVSGFIAGSQRMSDLFKRVG